MPAQRMTKHFTGTKGVDAEKRTVIFIASNENVDRYGDSIKASGWDLKNFQNNPVILFGHDYDSPPIGKALRTWIEGTTLLCEVQFATAEEYPFADTIFKLVVGGYLNAVSVGFMPKRWEYVDDDTRWGWDILEAELYELSVVPIPAHPEALVASRSLTLEGSGDVVEIGDFKTKLKSIREQQFKAAAGVKSIDDSPIAPSVEAQENAAEPEGQNSSEQSEGPEEGQGDCEEKEKAAAAARRRQAVAESYRLLVAEDQAA